MIFCDRQRLCSFPTERRNRQSAHGNSTLWRARLELWPKLGDGVNGKAEYHSVFEPPFFIEGAIFRACQSFRRSCYSGAKTCLVSSNLVQAEIFARATTP